MLSLSRGGPKPKTAPLIRQTPCKHWISGSSVSGTGEKNPMHETTGQPRNPQGSFEHCRQFRASGTGVKCSKPQSLRSLSLTTFSPSLSPPDPPVLSFGRVRVRAREAAPTGPHRQPATTGNRPQGPAAPAPAPTAPPIARMAPPRSPQPAPGPRPTRRPPLPLQQLAEGRPRPRRSACRHPRRGNRGAALGLSPDRAGPADHPLTRPGRHRGDRRPSPPPTPQARLPGSPGPRSALVTANPVRITARIR